MAIVHGIKKFRSLIVGAPIMVIMDNKAMEFLKNKFTQCQIDKVVTIHEYNIVLNIVRAKSTFYVSRVYSGQNGN